MASGGLELLARGAEALLYKIDYYGLPAVLKVRISKPYRHPEFDKLFRYRRTIVEGKVMSQLHGMGLRVPAVYLVDPDNYCIVMEYIEGARLSNVFGELDSNAVYSIAYNLGLSAAVMHEKTIYHGDFTIANIIVDKNNTPYIIDFGLSGYSRDIEEYAIDIHLLLRSIEALYPEKTSIFMDTFWKSYEEYRGHDFVVKLKDKVKDIRLRGRYVEERLRRKISLDKYV